MDAGPQNAPLMTDRELKQFGEFIYTELGIKITTAKKTMLQARLQRRLRMLNLRSYGEYLDYLQTLKGLEVELPQMVDAVTTNTTSFFREPRHFEFLTRNILPNWQKEHPRSTFTVWNAGCSSGEEPYTTAMVLMDYHERISPLKFSIVATDISTDILQKAARAVYEEEKTATIPPDFRRKFLLRSKNTHKRLVRIVPELRTLVSFRRLNFMDDFQFREKMDLIFCRNVMIYFDRKTQAELVEKFCNHLVPGGYFFCGHSESLAGINLPLKQLAPATYQRI